MSVHDNPSWADFKRGFSRAGQSAKKTAAYAKKRASLNAALMMRKKELAEAQAWLDKALDCMNELHVRSPNELSAGGRELVEGRRDGVKKAKKRADEAAKELQSFIRTRRNPTVGIPHRQAAAHREIMEILLEDPRAMSYLFARDH